MRVGERKKERARQGCSMTCMSYSDMLHDCVCVCQRERERERERGRKKEIRVCVRVCGREKGEKGGGGATDVQHV